MTNTYVLGVFAGMFTGLYLTWATLSNESFRLFVGLLWFGLTIYLFISHGREW